jgi:hypothetical protein
MLLLIKEFDRLLIKTKKDVDKFFYHVLDSDYEKRKRKKLFLEKKV